MLGMLSKPSRLLVAFVLLGALSAGLLASCSDDDGDAVTIYSGRTEDLIGPLLEQYANESGTGIDVRYGDSGDLALLIEQEGDRSPADVFVSQSPGALGYLAGAGRLQKLPDDVLTLVPERFESDAGDWVGLSGRVRVLVYNTELVDESELPGSVFDLTDPASAREFYRRECEQNAGVMLEMEPVTAAGVEGLCAVFKYRSPVPGSLGMAYVGILWLPFRDCRFQVNVEAIEQGTTGIREAAVMVI